MKKNLLLALAAIFFVTVVLGCGSRDSRVQTNPAKISPPRVIKPVAPQKGPKLAALAAVQETAQKLGRALAALNASNTQLMDSCSPLLATATRPGYDEIVASLERPVVEPYSMLGLLCLVEKQIGKTGRTGQTSHPYRLVVSEEFTLLKRRASVLRTAGVQTAAKLEAYLGAFEKQVDTANLLLAQLCREVRTAAEEIRPPSDSPLGRLASTELFVHQVLKIEGVYPRQDEMDRLTAIVWACDAKFLLLGGVTELQLNPDGLALLDPEVAIAPSGDPHPYKKEDPKPGRKQKENGVVAEGR